MMMNFELRAESVYHVIVEILSIICYDASGQAISTDDVILDKASHLSFH